MLFEKQSSATLCATGCRSGEGGRLFSSTFGGIQKRGRRGGEKLRRELETLLALFARVVTSAGFPE